MATPEVIAEQQALVGINADYKEKFGFHDSETGYAFKAPKGLTRELVEQISEFKNEPAWMREFRLKALDHFLARPQPTWGSPMLAEVDYDNIHYFVRASEKSVAHVGRRARRHQEHVRPARHPRGRAQVPRRRRRAVRVRGRLPPGARGPREAGRRVHGHGLRPARARGPRARVLRDGHPGQRQQARRAQLRRLVGRLVRLRAAGRARRDAAAGLLPHQHREHGPVRADADHRRRGLLRALRRGLHGAGLDVGLAALRGRRADRQAGRADPLHDRAELVAERLQPRHQARDRRDATRRSSGSTATSARSSR